MCRLFGLVADHPVDLRYWMQDAAHAFVGLSSVHAHGWGLAWYANGKPHIVKEPISAATSELFGQTVHQTRSNLILAHIRKATCGAHTLVNSHPFQNESYFFAHNGSVDGENLKKSLPQTELRHIHGETDSEIYFQWLLKHFKEKGVSGIREALRTVREKEFTALNFVFSDGEILYGYWEQSPTATPPNPNYYRLYFAARKFESGPPNAYGMERAVVRGVRPDPMTAMIVCSEKLDDGAWESLPEGSLLAISSRSGKHLTELR